MLDAGLSAYKLRFVSDHVEAEVTIARTVPKLLFARTRVRATCGVWLQDSVTLF